MLILNPTAKFWTTDLIALQLPFLSFSAVLLSAVVYRQFEALGS